MSWFRWAEPRGHRSGQAPRLTLFLSDSSQRGAPAQANALYPRNARTATDAYARSARYSARALKVSRIEASRSERNSSR